MPKLKPTTPRKTRREYAQTAYTIWGNMMIRCHNEAAPGYKYYGARGIKVCRRWRHFPNFLEDMGEPPPGEGLERINPKRNYSPSNCRWSGAAAQAKRRYKRFVKRQRASLPSGGAG